MPPEQDTTESDQATQRAESLVEVSDLHIEFPSREGVVHAASGVTFDIKVGETLGLVGESGSGKTVTAQAILRIIPHPGRITSGSITLHQTGADGSRQAVDLTSIDEGGKQIRSVRRHEISLIMQEPMSSLSPVHTIGNQIIEKVRLDRKMTKKDARERSIELLDMVGIPNAVRLIDSYSFEMSGGMRQRAVIAMALASSPSLLIADEPTTAVDVTTQAQILRLLSKLQDDLGMTILVITHDLGVVANMADRVAVMYRGRVVEQGPVLDVFESPQHPYTQGLVESVPDLSDAPGTQITTIPGVVPHPYAVVAGCQFHPRCSQIVEGVCDRRTPYETEPTPGHTVSCFLYEEEG